MVKLFARSAKTQKMSNKGFDCRWKADFEHELNRLCSSQLHNSFNTLNNDLSGEYESKCKSCPMCNSSICNNDELSIKDVEILQKWSDENEEK